MPLHYSFHRSIRAAPAAALAFFICLQFLVSPAHPAFAESSYSGPIMFEDFNGSTTDLLANGWWAARDGTTSVINADIENWGGIASGYHTRTVEGDRAFGFYKSAPGNRAYIRFRYTVVAQSITGLHGSFDFESNWVYNNTWQRLAGFSNRLDGGFGYTQPDGSYTRLLTSEQIGRLSSLHEGLPSQTWLSDAQMDQFELANRNIQFSLPEDLTLYAGDVITFTWNAMLPFDSAFEKNIQVNIDNFTLSGESERWPTSLDLSSSLDPASSGQEIAFTATLNQGAAGVPTGMVSFYDGLNLLGEAALDPLGNAVFATSALEPGLHTITAQYLGDGNFEPSQSAGLTQSVRWPVSISLISSDNPAGFHLPLSLTAVLSETSPEVPGGYVEFYDGAALLGSSPVNAEGTAELSVSDLALGDHLLVARYPGSALFEPAASQVLQQSIEGPTNIDLAALEIVYATPGIGLSWETVSELEMTGFNIYRSAAGQPSPEKINPAVIPPASMGQPVGNTYEWMDPGAKCGIEYQYWLEVLHESGAAIMNGPLSAYQTQILLPILIRS